MSDHVYKLGQVVALTVQTADRTSARTFEVVRLLPASVDGEVHYRVRGSDNIERAVAESQMAEAPLS